MNVPWDAFRQVLVESGYPEALLAKLDPSAPRWDTEALQRDFEVQAFAAPYVIVRRKADGARGTLMFTHRPRWYFAWEREA